MLSMIRKLALSAKIADRYPDIRESMASDTITYSLPPPNKIGGGYVRLVNIENGCVIKATVEDCLYFRNVSCGHFLEPGRKTTYASPDYDLAVRTYDRLRYDDIERRIATAFSNLLVIAKVATEREAHQMRQHLLGLSGRRL